MSEEDDSEYMWSKQKIHEQSWHINLIQKKVLPENLRQPKKDEEMNYVWSDMMYSVVMNRNSNFPINRIHMDFIILPSKKDDIIFVEEQITKPQFIGIDLALIHQILIIYHVNWNLVPRKKIIYIV